MRWSVCTVENLDGKSFCGDCGAALVPTYPSCGYEVQPGKHFCGGC
jgi:hypothetical protein